MVTRGKTMDKMIDLATLAAEYRLPLRTTQEDLDRECLTLIYEKPDGLKRVLVAEYFYNPDGKSWIAAVYEFANDDETTCEDFIGIREISTERFTNDGNAIAWAIQHA